MFQEANLDKFAARKHVLNYVVDPKNYSANKYVLEPLSLEVGETEVDDAMYGIERFTGIKIVDGIFEYSMLFERSFRPLTTLIL